MFQQRFPAWAEKVEFWHVDDAPEALALIENEIMDLVARFFGGGGKAPSQEIVHPQPARDPAKNPITVKVGRETAGRRGKGVTTVFDLPLDENGMLELAAKLKQRCGTGGTVKDGRIEIQGDQQERLVAELEKLGYKVKRVDDLRSTSNCRFLLPAYHVADPVPQPLPCIEAIYRRLFGDLPAGFVRAAQGQE